MFYKGRKFQLFFSLIMMILLIIVDQFAKYMAIITIKNNDSVEILKGVIRLNYYENTGAAFSSFLGMSLLLGCFSIVLGIVIFYFFLCIPNDLKYKWLSLCCILLEAGCIGNLIDRLYRGYVVDFVDFYAINFAIFNFADCYVVCAVVIIFLCSIFVYNDEDFIGIKNNMCVNNKLFKLCDRLFKRNKHNR